MKKLNGTNLLLAAGGLAVGAYLFSKAGVLGNRVEANISQKITRFKFNGVTFVDSRPHASFLVDVAISNKNQMPFPIEDLRMLVNYKTTDGKSFLISQLVPNYQKYKIIGAKDGVPGVTNIQNLELAVDVTKIPGMGSSLLSLAKNLKSNRLEFELVSKLKVAGFPISSTSNYKF